MQSNLDKFSDIHAIRESSLFSGIQRSVQDSDKQNFSLLLAMVTQDVMELDEFHLPQNKTPKTHSDLEQAFNVIPKKLFDKVNDVQNLQLNQVVNSGLRQSLALLLNLNPQPLITSIDDHNYNTAIPDNIISNLNVNQQAKYYQNSQSDPKTVKHNQLTHTSETSGEINNPDPLNDERIMDIDTWFGVLEQARSLNHVA